LLYLKAIGSEWKKHIKLSPVDIFGSSWVSAMEVHYKIGYRNFGDGLPGVVFMTIFYLIRYWNHLQC